MTTEILAPFFGTNDTEAVLVGWSAQAGARLEVGTMLCELETTKATVEVHAHSSGFFFPIIKPGETVKTNQLIGVVADSNNFDVASYLADMVSVRPAGIKITKKAELLIHKNGLAQAEIEAFSDKGDITEDLVRAFMRNQVDRFSRVGIGKGCKVAIIGGVAGGGALIVADAVSRNPAMQAVAIYDKDTSFHGKYILGTPVVGSVEAVRSDLNAGRIDAAVIAFNRDLSERDRLFKELRASGVPFVNVIDPSADIRSDVEIGQGNVILGRVYLGACSRIADNNFISANVSIEHGNILGSSCGFGPGVFTSGNVTIGDRVRFGTGIFVEPGLTVGDDAVIGSGQTLVTSVRDGTVLTSKARV